MSLRCAFLLFNCEQGMKSENIAVMKKLDSLKIRYALIMTKTDLFPKSRKLRTLLELRTLRDTFARDYCLPQPFLVRFGFDSSFLFPSLCIYFLSSHFQFSQLCFHFSSSSTSIDIAGLPPD